MFHWFIGDSVIGLREALIAAGDNARLEVHQSGDHMFLQVHSPVIEGQARRVIPEFNDSRACPPICP